MPKQRRIAVIDLETDPFLHGRPPMPFCAGYFDGEQYVQFWGDDCIEYLVDFLESEPETVIYAHNGGKFDFHYFLSSGVIGNPIMVNNGRIMKAKLLHHEIRDSYSAIPVPLATYQKDEIDYSKFERPVREKYKSEILKYLESDCRYLFELMTQFINRFGLKLTVGSVALKELKKASPFMPIKKTTDEMIRQYYHGGRVQPFMPGINKGNWKVYDVNSMYPYVMKTYQHPIGSSYIRLKPNFETLDNLLKTDEPFFIDFSGYSKGALPVKTKKGLYFPDEYNRFHVTSHEIKVALKYDLLRIEDIHEIIVSSSNGNFAEYVDKYIVEKIAAKEAGKKADELFAKLLLNSAYGKTGQNPENFYDWHITFYNDLDRPEHNDNDDCDWELFEENSWYEIWRRPNKKLVYHNVGIAASITGAARAVLLDGINNSSRVAYCDTDSLICESLDLPLHPTELGAWDLEAEGDLLGVGGKKLYVLFQGKDCTKKASKGVKFSPSQIFDVCQGKKQVWKNDAPSLSISSPIKFITRTVQKTA